MLQLGVKKSYCCGGVHSIISLRKSAIDFRSMQLFMEFLKRGASGQVAKTGALGPGANNGQMSPTGCFPCGDPSVQGNGCSPEDTTWL